MTKTLWRWSQAKDDWELITQATAENTQSVLRNYKRRDLKTAKFRWTDGVKPKKFRKRVNNEDSET